MLNMIDFLKMAVQLAVRRKKYYSIQFLNSFSKTSLVVKTFGKKKKIISFDRFHAEGYGNFNKILFIFLNIPTYLHEYEH